MKCPKCGKEVSEKSPLCPYCSFPLAQFLQRVAAAKAEIRAKATAQAKARRTKGLIIGGIALVLIPICAVAVWIVLLNFKYNDAIQAMDNGNYPEAIAAFEDLGSFRDSSKKLREATDLQESKTAGGTDSGKSSNGASFTIPKEALEASSIDTSNMTEKMKQWAAVMSAMLLSSCEETHVQFDGNTLYLLGVLSTAEYGGRAMFTELATTFADFTRTPNSAMPEAQHITISITDSLSDPNTFFIAEDGEVTALAFAGVAY